MDSAATFGIHLFKGFFQSFKLFLILLFIPFAVCLLFSVILNTYPQTFVRLIIALYISFAFVLTIELWHIYIFIFRNFSAEENVVVVSPRHPADSETVGYVNEIKNSTDRWQLERKNKANMLYENKNFYSDDIDVEKDIDVFVFNTTDMFSTILIDGLIDLRLMLAFTMFILLLAWTQSAILIWHRKNTISLINLLQTASSRMFESPCLYLQFATTFVFLMMLGVYYVVVLIYLLSISVPTIDGRGFVNFVVANSIIFYLLSVAHFLGCVWMWNIACTCEEFVLARALSSLIFQPDYKNNAFLRKKYFSSFYSSVKLIKYNFGTIVLGSMAVTFFEYNKFFLYFITRLLKAACKTRNTSFSFYINGVEQALLSVNRRAIVCAAIYGHNFCESARQGYILLLKHAEFLLNVSNTIFAFLFSVKCLVVITSLVFNIFFLKAFFLPELLPTKYSVLLILLSIVAFSMAQCFFNMYGTFLDTLIICYCDDLERNNGEDLPFFISSQEQKYISSFSFKPKKKKKTRFTRPK